MTLATFSHLVGSIYDSTADETLWNPTLGKVCSFAEGCLATLGVIDTDVNNARFMASWGDAGLLQALATTYSGDVPFYRAVPHLQLDTPYTVDSLYDIQGAGAREAWLDSRIAKEWVIPNQLDDFFWVPLINQPSRSGTLVVVTNKQRRKIDHHDLAAIAELSPHVRRAVTIGDLFAKEKRRIAMLQSVLEAFETPVMIVTSTLDLLFANATAEALLKEAVLFRASANRLACTYAPAQVSLAQAVGIGAKQESAMGGRGINVPLGRTEEPAVAHVLPLARRDRSVRISEQAAAAIFVGHSGQITISAMDAISALFGLTAAECRVANQVAMGRNRQEISLANGTSPTTVQSQLNAIYEKTDTTDQRSLELLIRDLTPPVRQTG